MANIFLNLFFPPKCGICGKIGKDFLCENCYKNSKKLEINKINNINDLYVNKHMYIFRYTDLIRDKIIEYKFEDKSYLYRIFEKIILNNKKVCDFIKCYDIITPVPINKKRYKERGYNQSLLIARKIAKYINNIELKNNIIIKNNNIKTQSSLNREERKSNIIGAFRINKNTNILNKKILIFDDIYTTGSTVNECAKVLKNAGAKEVSILTIAKD